MTSRNMKQSANTSNPRRQPAHLSVSLKHGSPVAVRQKAQALGADTCVIPGRPCYEESNESGESSRSNIKHWFDIYNKQPSTAIPRFEDDEPPYFLPHESSNESNEIDAQHIKVQFPGLTQHVLLAAENDSSADDYRSVIDDLTIENKKLKERLRKYESMHNAHLDKDKLFEVKIYSLPPSKRRELEDTLRVFASSIDESENATNSQSLPKPAATTNHLSRLVSTSGSASKHRSSSSSNSRPIDSAYASMSNSGPTSTSNLMLHRVSEAPTRESKDQKVQSFLDDIPEGLLPKHAMVMTERQKKKLVVRRLEQIFTGKIKGVVHHHSQHLQQQEISKSAARAHEPSKNFMSEGLREASILPHAMDVDQGAILESNQNDLNSISPDTSGSAACGTPDSKASLDQRPTRPLDLDPDREQNPLDNLEYIRHLGLSTPQLMTEDSSDAGPDAEGWVYLNLLTNMAQLHIMNVTPDFVRSSLSEFSTKFQLSQDGKRIRWRGGTAGTRLSSDSDSPLDDQRQDSGDTISEVTQKRRKLDGSHGRTVGQFTSVPIQTQGDFSSFATPGQVRSNAFHYKPLFHFKSSENKSMSLDEGSSSLSTSPVEEGRSGMIRSSQISGHRSRSGSSGQKQRNSGPIVFYSGAAFCTDLSSDRTNIPTPLHVADMGLDGYSNNSDAALGCTPRRPVSTFVRTPSGSLMRSRPFKDYSKVGDSIRGAGIRTPTPDLMADDSTDDENEMAFPAERSSNSSSDSSFGPALLAFSASGLGGTQPADHFAITVQTLRTKLGGDPRRKKCSKLSTPSLHSRKVGPNSSKNTLDPLREMKRTQTAGDITERLASLTASSSQERKPLEAFPVASLILSTRVLRLKPSELPEPLSYYDAMSNSDDESECSESSVSGLSKNRRPESFNHRLRTQLSNPDIHSPYEEMSPEVESDDEIDILASLRQIDPANVAAKEHEFEMEVDKPTALSAASSIATVGSGSGYSSGRSSDE